MPETEHSGEYPQPEDFAAAWASKCEELARETAKVTALTGVLREVLESRSALPFDADRYGYALKVAWTVIEVDEARQDEDFMARLERVRATRALLSIAPDGVNWRCACGLDFAAMSDARAHVEADHSGRTKQEDSER